MTKRYAIKVFLTAKKQSLIVFFKIPAFMWPRNHTNKHGIITLAAR